MLHAARHGGARCARHARLRLRLLARGDDAANLTVVGVVTERDVCCGVAADDRRASEVRVDEIMQPASACCAADDSLEDARRKIHEHRATTLPVVDKAGGCCGTVSMHRVALSG